MKLYVGYTCLAGNTVIQIATLDPWECAKEMAPYANPAGGYGKIQIWQGGKRGRSLTYTKFVEQLMKEELVSLESQIETTSRTCDKIKAAVGHMTDSVEIYNLYPDGEEKEKIKTGMTNALKLLDQADELIEELSDEMLSMEGY